MEDKTNPVDPGLRDTWLAEMRATKGWEIFMETMRDKYQAAARSLITGTSRDEYDIAYERARCKLVRELLTAAGIRKEESTWMTLL